MLLLNRQIGIDGTAWATPAADFGAMLIAEMTFCRWGKRAVTNAINTLCWRKTTAAFIT